MSGTAPILKELHHLRRHIKDLDSKIEQLPRQLNIQKAKLAKAEDSRKTAHDTIQQLALEIRDKEGSVKATQQQVTKYEKQLTESTVKKEYEALKKEIADEKEIIGKLEDEILAAIASSEEKSGLLPEVEKITEKARADYALYEKDYQERADRLISEKARAQDQLKVVEASLPEEIRIQYERLIAAKGLDSIAGVKGRTCLACYVEITSQMLSELGRGVFMLCKNCGRMLYVDK